MSTPAPAIADGDSLTGELKAWLARGGSMVGQVVIIPLTGRFELRHVEDGDVPPRDLRTFIQPTDARELAKFDAAGRFRPLKSAPNLVRGWRLEFPSVADVRAALDFFYPAALGNWVRFLRKQAKPVALRETLGRQTGIYRPTALMTDAQAAEVVCATCEPVRGCLRRIVWTLDGVRQIPGLPAEKFSLPASPSEWPVLCLEACNWLISRARSHLRREPPTPSEAE